MLLIAARMLGASSQKQNASFAEKFLRQLSSHATDQIDSNQGQSQEQQANSTQHEWLARKEFSQTQKKKERARKERRRRKVLHFMRAAEKLDLSHFEPLSDSV